MILEIPCEYVAIIDFYNSWNLIKRLVFQQFIQQKTCLYLIKASPTQSHIWGEGQSGSEEFNDKYNKANLIKVAGYKRFFQKKAKVSPIDVPVVSKA